MTTKQTTRKTLGRREVLAGAAIGGAAAAAAAFPTPAISSGNATFSRVVRQGKVDSS